MSKAKYTYEGPVMEFERIVERHWTGSTIAPSEKKARSNLAYRYKMENGKTANTKISLPGEIKRVM